MKKALCLAPLLATAAGASDWVVSAINSRSAGTAPTSLTLAAVAAAMLVMALAYARRHRVRVIRVRRRWQAES